MIKTIIVILSVLVLIIAAGCGSVPTTVNQPTPTGSADQGYPPANAPSNGAAETAYPVGNGLQIITSDGQAHGLSIADLASQSQAKVGSESGPLVTDVLKLAGVNDFASLTFTGSNGSTTLTKDKVNDQVILSLANNTITLVDSGVLQESWIKDITSVTVK